MIKKRNALYHLFVCTRDPGVLKEFKTFRNHLTKLLKQAKRDYYYSMFDGIVDVKQMWNKLNSVLSRSRPGSTANKLKVGSESFKNEALANKFNEYFLSLAESTHDQDALTYLPNPLTHSLYLYETDDNEIINVFKKFRRSKSEDVNGLKSEPIFRVIDLITPCLTHIYNMALTSGIFPQQMKVARVTVVHKGGERGNLGNYRPISILPLFSKGLEKIILLRMSSFFDKHSVITSSQHGFRSGCSTETALLKQKEIILNSIEARKLTLGVFLDFSKAFDRINHATLLDKLNCYGIRGIALDLIRSYITDRKQSVSINRHYSSLKPIRQGVPQGSILGPLLFIIYINDIVNVDDSINYIIYADDTSFFVLGTKDDELIHLANEVLRKIYNWSVKNSLQLNCSKTKAVLFRAKSTPCDLTKSLTLNDSKVVLSASAKTLGVIFHELMTWDHHTDYLKSKLSKALGMLRRCQKLLPIQQKLMIYNALFASHLRYCHLVWSNSTKQSLDHLVTLQKQALRAIADVPYNEHTRDLFLKFKIIRVDQFYEYQLMSSFKHEMTKGSTHMRNIANLSINQSSRLNRHTEHWAVPRPRTNYGFQTLSYCLPSTLNKYKLCGDNICHLSKKTLCQLILGIPT